MKKETKILSLLAVVFLVASILAAVVIHQTTDIVTANTVGYKGTGINFIMSDTYNNKECEVTYTYDGVQRNGKIGVNAREVLPTYDVYVNSKGNIVQFEHFLLIYTCIAYSVIMCIAAVCCIRNEKKQYRLANTG